MSVPGLSLLCLAFALCAGHAVAMPALQDLTEADVAQPCACTFGATAGKALLYWPQPAGDAAYLREPGGLRKLRLFSARNFPEPRDPPRPGDRQVLMFSDGTWHVQAVGEVVQVCRPKARKCAGTVLRNRLVVQWAGREKVVIDGWGRCSCRE